MNDRRFYAAVWSFFLLVLVGAFLVAVLRDKSVPVSWWFCWLLFTAACSICWFSAVRPEPSPRTEWLLSRLGSVARVGREEGFLLRADKVAMFAGPEELSRVFVVLYLVDKNTSTEIEIVAIDSVPGCCNRIHGCLRKKVTPLSVTAFLSSRLRQEIPGLRLSYV